MVRDHPSAELSSPRDCSPSAPQGLGLRRASLRLATAKLTTILTSTSPGLQNPCQQPYYCESIAFNVVLQQQDSPSLLQVDMHCE